LHFVSRTDVKSLAAKSCFYTFLLLDSLIKALCTVEKREMILNKCTKWNHVLIMNIQQVYQDSSEKPKYFLNFCFLKYLNFKWIVSNSKQDKSITYIKHASLYIAGISSVSPFSPV
jgi:hypothetical protein